MLTPEQVKPLLSHEDPRVRTVAFEYFGGSWSRDPEIAPLVLDAWDRFGDSQGMRGLGDLDQLLLTESAFDRVLDRLAGAKDYRMIEHLNRVLAAAPLELLIARDEAIRANANLDPKLVPRLDRLRDFAGWTGEKLWEELQDFARRADREWAASEGDFDLAYADDLIKVMAHLAVPDDDALCQLLCAKEPEESWLEIFLVDLAGERRLHRAVPALLGKLDQVDADYLLESACEALAKLGDPEASRLIHAGYADGPYESKYSLATLLGKIKHPESEAAILALLEGETETDLTFRTMLCMSLCELFSERGIEVVLREIEQGYDDTFTNLKDDLLPVAEVLGIELPEAARWKKERDDRERIQARRIAKFEEETRRFKIMKAQGIDPLSPIRTREAKSEPRPTSEPESAPLPISPIRHETKRIGRNDPCPCGSGKKFKKCCGRGA